MNRTARVHNCDGFGRALIRRSFRACEVCATEKDGIERGEIECVVTKPYSEAFKRKMVERLIGKDAISAVQLSRETGVRQQNLSRWLMEVRSLPRVAPQQRAGARLAKACGVVGISTRTWSDGEDDQGARTVVQGRIACHRARLRRRRRPRF